MHLRDSMQSCLIWCLIQFLIDNVILIGYCVYFILLPVSYNKLFFLKKKCWLLFYNTSNEKLSLELYILFEYIYNEL